jgi:hypothetical protein
MLSRRTRDGAGGWQPSHSACGRRDRDDTHRSLRCLDGAVVGAVRGFVYRGS